MEKIISIINLKGGTAKTFTAITMAQILATKYNKRVLLIDNDPQGNSSQFLKAYNAEKECGTSKLLRDIQASEVIEHTETGVDIITANLSIVETTSQLRIDEYYKFNDTVQGVAENYDYCIIDNPPSVNVNVLNALMITDDVIVPLEPSIWSLDGLEMITGQIDNAKHINTSISLIGCLITRYKNTEDGKAAETWLRNSKYPIFQTKIRYSDKVEKSVREHVSITECSKRSAAAVDYTKFVAEYIERGK